MFNKPGKTAYILVCAVLIVLQLAGCGTLMYPERRGQKSGRIDTGVAVMDGLCLFLFIIPGIIAYAVDFSNGTIYLPGTVRGSLDLKGMKQVTFDPRHYTDATVEKIIKEETGHTVKLNQDNIRISRLGSIDEMMTRLAEVLPVIEDKRIALSMR